MTDETKTDPTTPESGTATAEPAAETGAATDEKPAKLPQQVEFKDIGPCKKHIKVTIERSAIEAKMQEQFKKLVTDQEVAVPGFRPGKAPRKVIEKRFHKDVTDQVKGEVLLQSLEQLADDHDVAPLSAPNLDPTKIVIPEQGPFIYEFEVEVRPQFDLPNYKGLKLKRPVQTFTDADVEREQSRLLEPYGQLMPKPADGGKEPKLADGDYLYADLTTRDGDKVLSTVKEMKIRVQPRLAFKDGIAAKFGDQVAGAKPGDTRIVDIQLSDSVADPSLRGKSVKATIEVKDIKIVKLPEITHELCHEFGVHSAEQLRELIKVLLERRLLYQQRQSARQQVLAQIGSASSWELPQDLLLRQARSALNRRIMEMRSSGISEDEIRGRLRLLQQDTVQSTALALKEHFVMQKIAEQEKLEVSDDDIGDEIERIAGQYDESPRRVRARYEKEDMMDALAAEIIERKALDLVLNSAEYEDVPVGQTDDAAVSTVEEQAVPGEMKDPTAVPPEEEKPVAEKAE
jgi:trigger factor